jgi:hypothetical protein
MAEHNQNDFADATASEEPAAGPSAAQSNPAVSPGDAPSTLDFDAVDVRARRDGWTPEKQVRFIEELADCGVVREAAARVGMTEQSANRLRRRPDAVAFNRAWEVAIGIGADRLRSIAYERAVRGTVKPRYYKGERVGEEIVHDNRLLIYLLGKTGAPLVHVNARQVVKDWDRWMEAIENGIDQPQPSRKSDLDTRIWLDKSGTVWTDFPPPADFDSESHGTYGAEGYRRVCDARELDSIRDMQDREEARDRVRRDAWFGRKK